MADEADTRSTSESTQHARLVDAEQREYAAAGLAWFSITVRHVMRASDSIYASMSHESIEDMPDELIQTVGDEDPIVAKPMKFEASGELTTAGIVEGVLDEVQVMVAATANQMLAQTMAAMFAQIEEVTERVGNTVQAQREDLVEAYIEAIEKMDIRFDSDGIPQFQILAGPEVAEKFRQQFAAMTPQQARRIEEAFMKKKEAFDAARRRRRLPRHGE